MPKLACVWALLLVACTGDKSATRTSSAPLLSEPPDMLSFLLYPGKETGPLGMVVDSGLSPNVCIDDLETEDSSALTPSGTTPAFVVLVEVGGTPYLLVGSLDASDNFVLDRFSDTGSDGVPDQSSRVTLISSGLQIWPTCVSVVSAARVLLLDARCQDIWVTEDTDSDGWADSVQSTPFAQAADIEALVDVHAITHLTADNGDFIVMGSASPSTFRVDTLWIADADGDYVQDDFAKLYKPHRDPVIEQIGVVYAGLTSLDVRRGYVPGTVAISTLDEDGELDEFLGSVALTNPELELGTVTLSRALEAGEEIVTYNVDAPSQRTIDVVRPDQPQVFAVSPAYIETGGTGAVVVTLTGIKFTPTMVARLQFREGDTFSPVAVTYVSDTEATIQAPAQATFRWATVHCFSDAASVEFNRCPSGSLHWVDAEFMPDYGE